jgi:tetratricopeptide (TPR) repeat protein
MKLFSLLTLSLLLGLNAEAGQAGATGAQRFEVTSIKAVRSTLVNTVAALRKPDVAAAKAAFEAFDSGWNGVEVYINVRYPEMYKELEGNLETKINAGLNAPMPDTAALLADAQMMLAKYDETIGMIEKAVPLNRLYDDLARLRIVRAHLREVTPALKAGHMDKARESFNAFNDNWDSIEDLVRERSREAYVAIESGMISIEQALMPAQPNTDAVIGLVADVMGHYNTIVAEVNKEARSAK